MAEKEIKELTDEEEMEAGFADDDALLEQKTPEEAPPEEKSELSVTPPEPEPAPEYVQLTKAQYEALEKAAETANKNAEQIQKLFGTTGSIQKELKERPTGDGKGISALSAEEIGKLVGDTTLEAIRASQMETLDDFDPEWRAKIGAVKAGEKPDPEHPFRKWLATQPDADQKRITGTISAAVLIRAINRFEADTAKAREQAKEPPAPAAETAPAASKTPAASTTAKTAQRPNRFKNAIPPKTAGGTPVARTKTADDEFNEGFAQG